MHLQKNIFTSLFLILFKPSEIALNLLQKDFVNHALPRALDIAKKGDEIILDTHLIAKSQISRLPHNPEIKEIHKGKPVKIFYRFQLWIIFVIKKFFLRKYKKLSWEKLVKRYQLHQWYLIKWVK